MRFYRLAIGAGMCHIGTMPERPRKRPRDVSQLAKLVVDIATGEVEDRAPDDGKNPHAVALGRLGGQKGGLARAKAISAERRAEIAHLAARKRWSRSTRHDD